MINDDFNSCYAITTIIRRLSFVFSLVFSQREFAQLVLVLLSEREAERAQIVALGEAERAQIVALGEAERAQIVALAVRKLVLKVVSDASYLEWNCLS